MAYKTQSLNLQVQPIAGPRRFIYSDTGMTVANFASAGAITDAGDKGMKVGDVVEFRDNNTGISETGRMTVVQDTGNTQGTWVADTH